MKRILLIGYGNPGRLDDGLGPAFAEAVQALRLPGVAVESDYQLTVEDAAQVAEHDVVVFADAAVRGAEPFFFRRVTPGQDMSFSTHAVEPEAVLALAERLFHARPEAYALGIRGYQFDAFGEEISERARRNLDHAADFFRALVAEGDFAGAADPSLDAPDRPAETSEGSEPCRTGNT